MASVNYSKQPISRINCDENCTDHRIPLKVLVTTHSFSDIRKYLQRHGEDGTLSSSEIDEYFGDVKEEEVREAPRPQEPWYSVDEVRSIIANAKASWSKSHFSSSLAAAMTKVELDGIQRAICLGLGSLSAVFLVWEIEGVPSSRKDVEFLEEKGWSREAKIELLRPKLLDDGQVLHACPILQLAAFEWMAYHVSRFRSGDLPKLYAQDPLFNVMDVELLESREVSVLKDDEAWKALDEGTLIYVPHFPPKDWPKELIDSGAQIVIGNDVRAVIDILTARKGMSHDCLRFDRTPDGIKPAEHWEQDLEQAKHLEGFLERYHWVGLTTDNSDRAFSDTVLYWKK